MRFTHFDNLRSFTVVARHGSISAASEELCLTKGAISQQIKVLEEDLGFTLFTRAARGVSLTQHGLQLFHTARTAFELIENDINALRQPSHEAITLGLSTYLASRWLSPLLTSFLQTHPDIRLRVQPMIDLFDLQRDGIDVAIRWGNGRWDDMPIEKLFGCPAFAVGSSQFIERAEKLGLEKALQTATLLHDRDQSTAWQEWFTANGLNFTPHADTLTIPDPNVRVQAVIDGQGIALNDELVRRELANGELFKVGEQELDEYGYFLAIPRENKNNEDVALLIDWLSAMAEV